MSFALTEPAERDIRTVLRETLIRFGIHQFLAYRDIIAKGLEMIGDDPERGGSLDRSEIRPGVRLFHLELAAGRRGGAAHCLYYASGRLSNGVVGTIVLRLLPEGMEPRYRVVRVLRQLSAEGH